MTFKITSFENSICAKRLDSLYTDEHSAVWVVPGPTFYGKQDKTLFDS